MKNKNRAFYAILVAMGQKPIFKKTDYGYETVKPLSQSSAKISFDINKNIITKKAYAVEYIGATYEKVVTTTNFSIDYIHGLLKLNTI